MIKTIKMPKALACFLLLLAAATVPRALATKHLCANKDGVYVGLAVDEESYESIAGQKAPAPDADHPNKDNIPDEGGDIVQKWEIVEEKEPSEKEHPTPQRSFAGKFLQVLPPAKKRVYPGNGHRLKSVDQLSAESPYVAFKLYVDAENVGFHTAFVRWTGGKKDGGGDSLFVVMMDGSGNVVPGQRTLRPAMISITNQDAGFVGCCYDVATHACPCYRTQPSNETCKEENFFNPDAAEHFGVQCAVAEGVMEFVQAPKWYLYAGQERGSVMDFDSRPWDAACEAEGSNTMDSGKDFSMWNLPQAGDYELRIYAREDGTALDAVYIAGPKAAAPTGITKFEAGESTFCPERSGKKGSKKKGGGRWFLHLMFWALALGGVGYFVTKTDQGRELAGRAIDYVSSLRSGGGSSSYDSSRYEALGMNPN